MGEERMNKMKIIKNKFIVAVLTLTIITVVLFPVVNAGLSITNKDTSGGDKLSNDNKISDDKLDNNQLSEANDNGISDDSLNNDQIDDNTLSDLAKKVNQTTDELMSDIEGKLETKAKIGTFWWYRGDGGLIYAEGDAEGFASTLAGDGCMWSINKNSEDNELYDDYIQDGANELIDDVDIAYFVGHAGSMVLGIHKPFPEIFQGSLGSGLLINITEFLLTDYDEFAEAIRCSWGDDGPLKWVVLATCLAAHGGLLGFQRALKGTNMILGWDTACSDALYGPTFANKIKEGMTLKEAWFATADECEHVHARAKILGEDISVGNDYLKGYGSYANPKDDAFYYWWTHEVNGWQKEYSWVTPSSNNTYWTSGSKSHDNIEPDYTNEPDPTWAIFNGGPEISIDADGSWSAPLILTLNEPTTIRGFRIIANKNVTWDSNHDEIPYFDKMVLKFYEEGGVVPITTVTLTNWEGGCWRIIDFEEGSSYQAQATISGEREPTVVRVEIQIHAKSGITFNDYPAKISEFDFWSTSVPGIPNQETEYNIVSQQYNQEFFESIASEMDMSREIEYIDTSETYKIEDCEKTLKYDTQTGILSYIDPSKTYSTAFSEPIIPTDANAEDIAKNFLIECGLPANEIKSTIITYDTQGCGNKITGGILYEWVTAKTVYFERQINGVTLPGIIKVTIGENGDIASFKIPMQTLESTTNQNQNTQNVQNTYMNNHLINRLNAQLISLISSITLNASSISSNLS